MNEQKKDKKKIAIVAGCVHPDITDAMVSVAQKTLLDGGVSVDPVILVPGSYEVPFMVKELLGRRSISGVVVLGAIEKGETKHGEIMGQVVHQALMNLQLESGKPIGFGIIGPGAIPKQMHERKVKMVLAACQAVISMIKLKEKHQEQG